MARASVHETLSDAGSRLGRVGIGSSRVEAELLLRHVLQLGTREFLLLDRAVALDPSAAHRLEELLSRRLAREPLQYIIGTVQFCEFDFKVGPGVLIPRPETEVLVETVSQYISRDLGDTGVLVDIGTGTGAIAISLLARFPKWIGLGLDLSATALVYAYGNVRIPEVSAGLEEGDVSQGVDSAPVANRFLPVQSDLLSCVAGCQPVRESFRPPSGDGRCVDLIVSNPPYIPTEELCELEPEVRDREPRLALDGGEDGMACTRVLVSDAARVLRPGGLLALELALGQAEAVRKLAKGEGFVHRETYRDLTGRERGVILQRG